MKYSKLKFKNGLGKIYIYRSYSDSFTNNILDYTTKFKPICIIEDNEFIDSELHTNYINGFSEPCYNIKPTVLFRAKDKFIHFVVEKDKYLNIFYKIITSSEKGIISKPSETIQVSIKQDAKYKLELLADEWEESTSAEILPKHITIEKNNAFKNKYAINTNYIGSDGVLIIDIPNPNKYKFFSSKLKGARVKSIVGETVSYSDEEKGLPLQNYIEEIKIYRNSNLVTTISLDQKCKANISNIKLSKAQSSIISSSRNDTFKLTDKVTDSSQRGYLIEYIDRYGLKIESLKILV